MLIACASRGAEQRTSACSAMLLAPATERKSSKSLSTSRGVTLVPRFSGMVQPAGGDAAALAPTPPQTLQEWLDKVQPADDAAAPAQRITREHIEEAVQFIKISRCADEVRAKLEVIAPQWDLLGDLRVALKGEGKAEHKRGPAPAGYMERELGDWLEALK